MKKYFSFIIAIATLFAMHSCSQEEVIGNETSGNEVEVAFNLEMEGQTASRAIGDGLTVDEVIMGVFDEAGTEITNLKTTAPVSNLGAVVKVRLVKGQTYQFVFWAQKSGNTYYDLSKMDKITVNYNGYAANDEKRDAFYAYEPKTKVTGSFSKKVTLKRPFAQLNLGTTAQDIKWAYEAGVTITHSKVTVNKVYNTLNTLNGTVENEVEVAFTKAAIPDAYEEELEIKDKENLFEIKSYEYLASDYLLVNESKLTTSIVYELYADASENAAPINTLTIENAPLERNWRTNIVGEILTGEGTFNVVIDPIFDNEKNYPMDYSDLTIVNNADEFKAALDNADVKVIGLEKGLVLDIDKILYLNSSAKLIYSLYPEYPATFKGKFVAKKDVTFKNMVFEPNATTNKELLPEVTYGKNQNRYRAIIVAHYASTSFYGCTFNNLDTRTNNAINYWMNNNNNQVLTVDNCEFNGTGCAIHTRALCSITNSKFETPQALYVYSGHVGNGTVEFKNNEVENPIYLGTANALYKNIKFDVQQNNVETTYTAHENAIFDPNGSITFAAGSDKFSITADGKFGTNSELTVYSAEELANAVNNATADITVNFGKDLEGDIVLHQNEDVNVVVNGKDYQYVGTIEIDGDARQAGLESLTIDNVNFVTTADGELFIDANQNESYGNKYNYAHNITIKNCSFTATEAGVYTAVAMKYRGSKNVVVINCTATGMHTLLQAYGVAGISVNGAVVENGKNGISLGTSTNVEIKNSNIVSNGYGIRGGETSGASGDLVVENSTISANTPIVIRGVGMSNNVYSVTLKGTNTLNSSEYQIVFTKGNDDTQVAPAEGTYSIVGAEGMNIFK